MIRSLVTFLTGFYFFSFGIANAYSNSPLGSEHREIRFSAQGTFSRYKYFPSLGFEKIFRKNRVLKFSLGIPLASRYRGSSMDYLAPYAMGSSMNSSSFYSGVFVKVGALYSIYKNGKTEFRIGFDLGGYYIMDKYQVTHEIGTYWTGVTYTQSKGVFTFEALSIGAVTDLKQMIGKKWFIHVFPQGLFYFDSVPFGKTASLYTVKDPFLSWKIELGFGIGYTIIR